LAKAKGVVAMILPELGLGEWDREGADLHDQVGLNAFIAELANTLPSNVAQYRVKCHINDAEFADKALEIFDAWRADGTVQH
jgi:uncharacterized protein (UPF0261 family)